jgi:hypothetical protein
MTQRKHVPGAGGGRRCAEQHFVEDERRERLCVESGAHAVQVMRLQ